MEAATPLVFDVNEADFDRLVIQRSHELPVVVDFWAEWCAPCRQLGPVLERAVAERAGTIELAKLDTDANQALATRYRIQGIPAVKAFRNGEVAEEFTGALPPAQVEAFLDKLAPSQAEEAKGEGLTQAKELLARGEAAEALALVEPLETADFEAAGLATRARLELAGELDPALAEAFAALDSGDAPRALELLQEAVAGETDAGRRDELRKVMVGVFTELGADSELAGTHRRRLAAALS